MKHRKQKKARNMIVLAMILHTKAGKMKDKRNKRNKNNWRQEHDR